MLTELTISQFLDTTASSEPVPGGGSVSALCGALAAALTQMVARLTAGRKKYAEYDGEMQQIIERVEPLRQSLAGLVDLDSEAYASVMQAFRMPKETEAEKVARAEAIEAATKHAAEVPLNVARTISVFLPDIAAVAAHGNRNAVTDACVAAMCAHTAMRGALLNVQINLGGIKDQAFVALCRAESERLLAMSASLERDTLQLTVEAIS